MPGVPTVQTTSRIHNKDVKTTFHVQAFWSCTALQTVAMESIAVLCMADPSSRYDQFSGCTSLAAISVPDPDHAMTTWPHNAMFRRCPKQLLALLAAATAGMQLQYYWKPGAEVHALCQPSARRAVLTVLLVAVRLMHRWRASAHTHSAHVQARRQRLLHGAALELTARQAVLPDLPDELWFCILILIRRHELGGVIG